MVSRSAIIFLTAFATANIAITPAKASMELWIATFERVMGGLKVHDKQRSASRQQTQQVVRKSDEAGVNAILSQEQAYRVADIKNRYSYEYGQGEQACTVTASLNGMTGTVKSQDKMLKSFSAAESNYISRGGNAAASMKNSMLKRVGHYCTQEERAVLGDTYCKAGYSNERNAGDSNAGPFLFSRNYGPEEVVTAGDYVDVLAPYPTIEPNATDSGGQVRLIDARRRAALMSGARSVMMGVAVAGMGGDRQ